MADIVLDEQSKPATPSAGTGLIYPDSTASLLAFLDDAGLVHGRTDNASIASQGAGFSTDTYVTDSDLLIPSHGMQARGKYLWRISASKSNASTATPIYQIRTGSLRTTGDTSRVSLTGPAQTAIADIGTLNIMATVRNIGGSGVIQATAWWDHRGTAASTTVSGVGFANDVTGHVEGSGTFDNTTMAGLYIGLSINGGTNASWTLTQVWAEAIW